VGKDAAVLAQAIGVTVPPGTQLLIGQTNAYHAFVQTEQMMPFVPFVETRNVEEAMDLAIESEHGYRHTAIIHSQNMQTVTKFGRRAATTLFVVNGASPAGLGLGGQGYLSYKRGDPHGRRNYFTPDFHTLSPGDDLRRIEDDLTMQLGRVIGQATSTVKHESLVGWRLLIVQPLNNARQPEADPVLAIDKFNGGVGQMVIVNSDGEGARACIGDKKSPVRWYVVGIVNE